MEKLSVRITGISNSSTEINLKGDTEFKLILRPEPDSTWINEFNKAYLSKKSNKWRSAKILDSKIVISCHHNDLHTDHTPALQMAIDAANEVSQKIRDDFAAEAARKREAENEVREAKSNILTELNSKFTKGGA